MFWPDGLLDAYIATIPKVDGDVTPLGQRPLSDSAGGLPYLGFCQDGSARGLVSVLGSGFCF